MATIFADSITNSGPVAGRTSRNFNPLKDCYRVLVPEVLRLSFKDPSLPISLFRTVRAQQKAYRVRAENTEKGVCVPPVLIFSVIYLIVARFEFKSLVHKARIDATLNMQ